MSRLWRRFTGFYFPPWVPVVAVMLAVMGILGALFVARGATGSPRIGDHWHTAYQVVIWGEAQPPIPELHNPEGVHTHGDGIIHMHPFIPSAEGGGASVSKFVEYMGGVLSDDEVRLPTQRERYRTGDLGPNGEPGELRILRADSGFHPVANFNETISICNAKRESEFEEVSSRYVPHDGDCIRIVFGPEKPEAVVKQDRTIIPEGEATRTVNIKLTVKKGEVVFSPNSVELGAGETVKIVVENRTNALQGIRASGGDGKYNSSDDYVTEPPAIEPGLRGTMVVRFDEPGRYKFRDESDRGVTGTIIVSAADVES
ncbi:MAG: cupredoxin domain-containing protein [Chloroflexi bacterium]|nr:cupredoxin domain-containing protein [Chloroflexota bacterium]